MLAHDLASGFPLLVEHHQDLVYAIARRRTRHPADAEDLAQECFLRAWRALGGYGADRIAGLRLRGWLARITINLSRNLARDRGPDTSSAGPMPDPVDDGEVGPEREVERRDSARWWRALLATLPDGYRVAVELRHVEGLSYPELAEALGKPMGTVKSDVHRGVARLRQAYEAAMARDGQASMAGSRDGVRAESGPEAPRAAPEVMVR